MRIQGLAATLHKLIRASTRSREVKSVTSDAKQAQITPLCSCSINWRKSQHESCLASLRVTDTKAQESMERKAQLSAQISQQRLMQTKCLSRDQAIRDKALKGHKSSRTLTARYKMSQRSWSFQSLKWKRKRRERNHNLEMSSMRWTRRISIAWSRWCNRNYRFRQHRWLVIESLQQCKYSYHR